MTLLKMLRDPEAAAIKQASVVDGMLVNPEISHSQRKSCGVVPAVA